MRPWGLRARLAAWTALVAALTAGVPGSLLTWRAYRALSAAAYETQLELAHSLADELDDEFSQAISGVETAASRPSVLRGDNVLVPRLALVASAAQQLDDLLVVDSDGGLLGRAPTEEAPPDFSRDDRRALARQAEADRTQTISLLYSDPQGRLVLRLAHAMGRRATAMGQVRLDSQGIGDLGTLRLGTTGFAYLVDEAGRPLLLPTLAHRLAGGDPKALAFVFHGQGFVRVEGGPQGKDLLAVAPLVSLGWGVAVRRSLAEAEAPSRRMRRELILFTLLALGLGIFVALVLARPLVNRILALAAAARRIEAGRLDVGDLGAAEAGDEIGQVAGALTHLAGALKEQQAGRERAHVRALQAEKRAAQNERLASLGQLAAGLAHELNNPLMVIHGAAEEAGALAPSAARPWLERVRRESERCSRLVRELLDYARPRPPSPRPFDLAALAREVFAAARTGRSEPYELKLRAARPRVVGDPDQFQQVLLNLVVNAMDAMPSGGPVELGLTARRRSWRLTVRDSGPGVPARARETVFRPFFTSKPKGTGLGLAIARSLMLGHGGSLRCVSHRGKGACFEARWEAPTEEKHGG